jgi:hypothetical protein
MELPWISSLYSFDAGCVRFPILTNTTAAVKVLAGC